MWNPESLSIAEEQKNCQKMRWRDYDQDNLSSFDRNLGPVVVKMRQIIQEKEKKDLGKLDQNLWTCARKDH